MQLFGSDKCLESVENKPSSFSTVGRGWNQTNELSGESIALVMEDLALYERHSGTAPILYFLGM